MAYSASGRNTNAKMIMHRLSQEEGDVSLYALTDRQVYALLSLTTYLRWPSRHSILPEDINSVNLLHDWVDDLDNRLMSPVDPLSEVCAKIIDCIQNDEDVKQSFRDFFGSDEDILKTIDERMIDGKGKEISPTEEINTNLNLDELWAECVQITEYTHDAIVDLLEILEVQSNTLEIMKHGLEDIPMLQFLLDAIPVNSWLDTIDNWISFIGEQYAAQYTETIPTGTKWKMACSLFCMCRDDGVITVGRIYNANANLLSGYTVPSLDNLSEWIETVMGVNDNSELVVFATHALMWGIATLSSFFGLSTVTTSALQIILKIADNDANNDWETLCEDCANIVPCYDFTTGMNGWTIPIDNYATYHAGEGWGRGTYLDGQRLGIQLDFGSNVITYVKVTFNEPVYFCRVGKFYPPDENVAFHPLNTQSVFEFNDLSFTGGLLIDCGTSVVPNGVPLSPTLRLLEICVEYG